MTKGASDAVDLSKLTGDALQAEVQRLRHSMDAAVHADKVRQTQEAAQAAALERAAAYEAETTRQHAATRDELDAFAAKIAAQLGRDPTVADVLRLVGALAGMVQPRNPHVGPANRPPAVLVRTATALGAATAEDGDDGQR